MTELAGDSAGLASGTAKRMVWVFAQSPTTGKLGPSTALRRELRARCIELLFRELT